MELESIRGRSRKSQKVRVQKGQRLWTLEFLQKKACFQRWLGCLWLIVNGAPALKEEGPLGLLSCLRVPRPGSEPNIEVESGAFLRAGSAPRGPGVAGLLSSRGQGGVGLYAQVTEMHRCDASSQGL